MNIRDRYSRDQSSIALGSGINLTYYEGWTPIPALEARGQEYVIKTVGWMRNSDDTSPSSRPVLTTGYNYWGDSGYTDLANAVAISIVQGIVIDRVDATKPTVDPGTNPYVVYAEDDGHIYIWNGTSWTDAGPLVVDTTDFATKVSPGVAGNVLIQDAGGNLAESGISINDSATLADDDTVIPTESVVFTALADKLDASGYGNNKVLRTNGSGVVSGETIQTGFNLAVGTGNGTVAAGDDARFTAISGNVKSYTKTSSFTDDNTTLLYDGFIYNITAATGSIVLPSASVAGVGRKVRIGINFTTSGTLYVDHTTLGTHIATMTSTTTESQYIDIESNGTTWYIVHNTSSALPIGTTSVTGIVRLAVSGDTTAGKVVAADDSRLALATETSRGTLEVATNLEALTGSSDQVAITPAKLKYTIDALFQSIGTAVYSIGAWDMDTTASVDVTIDSFVATHIRSISVLILNDAADELYPIEYCDGTGISAGSAKCVLGVPNKVTLTRVGSGMFDSALFDDGVMDRGYVSVTYSIV